MAITLADFNKIWASTSPLTPYSFSEANYKQGWDFIGSTPPARQMWDFIQKQNDEKMQYIVNNYVPTNVPLSSMENVTALTNEHDLDNVLDAGTYIWNSSSYYPANIPTGVYYARMFVFKIQGNGYVTQLIYPHEESKGIWYRVKSGGSGTWSDWKHFAFAEDVLSLSGGTISGTVTFSTGSALRRNNENGLFVITGGYSGGATITLSGKERATATGEFQLTADNGTTNKTLVGNPDGTFTWGGNNVLTAANYNSYALPLSGGTMTAPITITSTTGINKNVDNSYLMLDGATSTSNGANLQLYGKDHSLNGAFYLFTNDGTNNPSLVGKPDGTLTWGEKNIERVNASETNYIRYESGLQICWGTGSTSGGVHQYTFPMAFSDTPNVSLTITSAENSDGYFCKIADLTTTGVKALTMKSDSTYIQLRTYYLAVGYWK